MNITSSPFSLLFQLHSPHLLHILFFCFLGPHLRDMEVPRPRVESELQLSTMATATAMPDPSRVCDQHHSSWQCWILNPLSKASDQTCILMVTRQIHFRWAATGTPFSQLLTSFLCSQMPWRPGLTAGSPWRAALCRGGYLQGTSTNGVFEAKWLSVRLGTLTPGAFTVEQELAVKWVLITLI